MVTTAAFSAKGKVEIAKQIDQIARCWGFPLVFIACRVITMILPVYAVS